MITCEEKFDSRSTVYSESVELIYVVRGTEDDVAVMDAVLNSAPEEYNEMARSHPQIEPIGGGIWIATVEYNPKELQTPKTGDSAFSFDTGGGTHHITQAKVSIGRYPATAASFNGAIGVSSSGVAGVDITQPVYNFAETHYLEDDVVTLAYRGLLFDLTGKVNNSPFKGLASGECLFLGASGSRRAEYKDWEILFKFAGSPNRGSFNVGGITVPAKKGWEYMWVRYADTKDSSTSEIIQKPVGVYIEQVYDYGNLSLLGIGT